MANIFSDLIEKAKGVLGTSKQPIMEFGVGVGLTPTQKADAETKIKQLAQQAPPVLPEEKAKNFFADVARDIPRSAGGLTLKYLTGQETFQPGTGVAPNIEKWFFGTEPIEKPKGAFQTGMAVLGALPILPGKKKVAEVGIKEVVGTKALQISKVAKEKILDIGNELKTELQAIKGKKLTYDEVKEAAKTSNILKQVTTRADTLRREAQIQATKQQLAALAEGKTITKEFMDALQTVTAEATNLGRQLNSLKIEAVPELATTKTLIIKKLMDLGIETDKILESSKGVDFTDANQVAIFYRKFVKPKLGEIIDEYRYINLLSSPRTHIVNAFSNLLQTTVLNPATKLFSGGLDLISSGVTGKARQAYVAEVPAYYKGLLNSIGDAVVDALKVIRGQQLIYRPDVARIPTKAKILAPFQLIPRILEASDVFFRTLITAGEKESLAYRAIKKGQEPTATLVANIEKEAAERAQYWVFRQGLNAKNQGRLLNYIDTGTATIYKFREVPLVNWFIPFVTTPMNILKQGIEFSPIGLLTLPGAINKSEQLAKALVGSTIFAGAGFIALKGDSTWATPRDETEKQYFYASGRQPYSLKIGDTWISYARLGPIAYPIAMASAIKYYLKDNPQAATQNNLEKVSRIFLGIGGFFSDQSYVQGIGNLLDILQGDVYATGRAVSNLPSQIVPLTSLQRWVARLIDPVFRKTEKGLSVESIIQNLQKGIPFISRGLPAYKEPLGEESRQQSPLTNALSPLGITVEKKDYEELYQLLMQKREMSAELRKIKEDLRKELGL